MIRVAIDINDTIRAFTNQYALQYQKLNFFDKNFNINNLIYDGDDMYSPFNFKSLKEREDFQYIDYSFEIYGSAKCIDKNIPGMFNVWRNDIEDTEKEEDIEISIIGGDENELSIQATLFFLSKNCTRVRNIEFPKSSEEIWNKFDMVVTADPRIIKTIPENKLVIRINTTYNEGSWVGENRMLISYDTFIQFLENKPNYSKFLKLK